MITSKEVDSQSIETHERSTSTNIGIATLIGLGATLPGIAIEAEAAPRPDEAICKNEAQQRIGKPKALAIESSDQFVANWQRNASGYTNVFVRGGVIDDANAQALSKRLATEHPNWTVVILDDGYREFTRRVDEALKKPEFDAIRDCRTGESLRSGAIFIVSKDDRETMYKTTELYSHYNVGDEDLGQKAMSAQVKRVFQEGDWAAGVELYVASVDGYLHEAYTSIVEQKEKNERRVESALEEAKERLETLRKDTKAFNRTYPKRTGDLARPDLKVFEVQIKNAQQDFSAGRLQTAADTTRELTAEISERIHLLSSYPEAFERLKTAGKVLETAENSSFIRVNAVIPFLDNANRAYDEGFAIWKQGGSKFQEGVKQAESAVNGLSQAIREESVLHHNTASMIDKYRMIGEELSHKLSGAQLTRLQNAQEKLEKAAIAHAIVEPTYRKQISDAVAPIEELKDQLYSSIVKKRVAGAGIAAGLVTAGIAALRRRRKSNDSQALAEKEIEDWKKLLDPKSTQLRNKEIKVKSLVAFKTPDGIQAKGQTKNDAKEILAEISDLYNIRDEAYTRLKKAEETMSSHGSLGSKFLKFRSDQHNAALHLLTEEKIEFNPKLHSTRSKLSVKRIDPFLASLQEFRAQREAFKLDFPSLMQRFDTGAHRVDSLLENLERTKENVDDRLSMLQASVESLEDSVRELGLLAAATDGRFILSDLKSTFLPNAEQALNIARQKRSSDYVGASRESELAGSNIALASKVVASIFEAREEKLPQIEKVSKALERLNISRDHIDQCLSKVSESANSYVKSIGKPDGKQTSLNLIEDIDAVLTTVQTTLAITNRIDDLNNHVRETRAHIAREVGTDSNVILREDNLDPSTLIEDAEQARGQALTKLGERNFVDALSLLTDAKEKMDQAQGITEQTLRVVENYDEVTAELTERLSSQSSSVEENLQILERIRLNYSNEVLVLEESGVAQPGHNGTLDDNIEEVRVAIGESAEALNAAGDAYRSGRILEAEFHLERLNTIQEFIAGRYEEIQDKETLLDNTTTANDGSIEQLRSLKNRLTGRLESSEITQATIDDFQVIKTILNDVESEQCDELPNPFAIKEKLNEVRTAFRNISNRIDKDHDEYRDFTLSIQTADKELNRAENVLKRVREDAIPDSQQIETADRTICSLREELDNTRQMLEISHADWYELDDRVDAVTESSVLQVSILEKQERQGEVAVESFRRAKRKVKEARNWTGSHGVFIHGTPGRESLSRGKALLSKGRYASSTEYFNRATSISKSAVRNANTKVESAIAAEASRRRAAERRRQAERDSYNTSRSTTYTPSSTTYGGSGGFGSSGGFSSGGSFGGSIGGFSSGGSF